MRFRLKIDQIPVMESSRNDDNSFVTRGKRPRLPIRTILRRRPAGAENDIVRPDPGSDFVGLIQVNVVTGKASGPHVRERDVAVREEYVLAATGMVGAIADGNGISWRVREERQLGRGDIGQARRRAVQAAGIVAEAERIRITRQELRGRLFEIAAGHVRQFVKADVQARNAVRRSGTKRHELRRQNTRIPQHGDDHARRRTRRRGHIGQRLPLRLIRIEPSPQLAKIVLAL